MTAHLNHMILDTPPHTHSLNSTKLNSANPPLYKAALKGQRGEGALQILAIHPVSPAVWGQHSHLPACLRRLRSSSVLVKFYSLEGELKPKGDLHKTTTTNKKQQSEMLWHGFELNLCEMK